MNGWLRGSPGRWGFARRVVGVWLVVALALGTVVVPEAWAAEYYVDTGGSDGNGGSSGAPWKTLTHALGQVTSGDVVHLAPGTYDNPANGEAFPLALVDGVTILGDTSNPAGTVISAPAGSQVFFNDDTSLGSTTRLAGVTLRHDADTDSPMMEFAVDAAGMSPQIDHNAFAGSATESYDEAISYYDDGSGSGSFTATIDNNTFTDLYTGTWMYSLGVGSAQVFSPLITNNTFTGCDYPVCYSISSYSSSGVEGTVGGLVQGNTFSGTNYNEIYIYFYPDYGGSGLVFNPTITGNDMQGAGSSNIYAGLYGGYQTTYPGNATFAPTITNNTMGYSNHYNIEMYGYYNNIHGDYTIAPTISGNTITAAGDASIKLSLTALSVSSSAQNVFSPTITNNTITGNGNTTSGISVSLASWENGQLEGTPTISGNTITKAESATFGASYGISFHMANMKANNTIDWSITISNNTIEAPGECGLSFTVASLSGSGRCDSTVEGNTISGASGAQGRGMGMAAVNWGHAQVTEVVLLNGNTVTGSTNNGISLYFTNQTGTPPNLLALVTDNVLEQNGLQHNAAGLAIGSNGLGYNGIVVACNTVTGNDYGIWQLYGSDPPADYGSGSQGSPGHNVLTGNAKYDFYNATSLPVGAGNNWWGVTDAATIDNHIYDDDEDGTKGAVNFDPPLSTEPTVTIGATLTDAVANDVAPAGASVGDTLQYTAVINESPPCSDASVSFSATVDANTTVVPGSVTTTQGTVTGESPPTVDVGFVVSNQPVTITWQVVVNGGASVETQGTVTGGQSGSTLTDDPDAPGASDPTVTVVSQGNDQAPGIPTLGQWGMLLFSVLLLLLGGWLLRRRRWAGAAVAVLLAVGMAAAPALAASRAKLQKQEVRVATVTGVSTQQGITRLKLDDGTTVTIPEKALDVREGHGPRLERKARPVRRTIQERREAHRLRRARSTAAARRALLQTGAPVLVTLRLSRDGSVRRARVLVFDTLAEAQGELARKASRRKHPRE